MHIVLCGTVGFVDGGSSRSLHFLVFLGLLYTIQCSKGCGKTYAHAGNLSDGLNVREQTKELTKTDRRLKKFVFFDTLGYIEEDCYKNKS